jgi:hypothetical protein
MFILLFILLAGYINKSENKKKEIKRINKELEKYGIFSTNLSTIL